MSTKRELGLINRQMRWLQQYNGEGVLWYEFDGENSAPPDYLHEGGRHYLAPIAMPVLWVTETEAMEAGEPEGQRRVPALGFALSMETLMKSGLSDPHDNERHLNDLVQYQRTLYGIGRYEPKGRLARQDVIVGCHAVKVFPDEDMVFDVLPPGVDIGSTVHSKPDIDTPEPGQVEDSDDWQIFPEYELPARHSGPITITTGGTYSGSYESLDPNVPAVTIATNDPVVLAGAYIRHKGMGVFGTPGRPDVTITDSTLIAVNPGDIEPNVNQLSLYLYQPIVMVVEHNDIQDGHGITIGGNNLQTTTFRIRCNNYTNVGRYGPPSFFAGALHTDQVYAPGGLVEWNRIVNEYGQSSAEDMFGIYKTNGASGQPIIFTHNFIDGVYPWRGDGASFTGAAIDLGDGGGSYLEGHFNTVLNYTNIGLAIPSGQQVYHMDSVAVFDGFASRLDSGIRVSSEFGQGINTWYNTSYPPQDGIGIINCRSAHMKWTGTAWERADFYLPNGTNTGNTSLSQANSATERSMAAAWEESRVAAGVVVGVRS